MKTFADFIAEAAVRKPKAPQAPNYNKVYAAKVAAVKKRQSDYVKAHRDKVQQHLQNMKDEEDHKKYVNHLTKQIRKDVKKEYGIEDNDD